jgi:DNA-binding response OmpR family regulator
VSETPANTDDSPRTVIVIAEDDPDILQLVAIRLERSGYEVHRARDGEQALELVSEHIPDLVVLDVLMPKLTGLDVTRRIRADPATREIPVILLTARVEEGDIKQGFEAGATDYLKKPFSPHELQERVMAIIDGTS